MVQTRSGVNRNLWRRRQSGLFAPDRRNFPIDGLIYIPTWHEANAASGFYAWDVANESVLNCVNHGATWYGNYGRHFDGYDDDISMGDVAALDFAGDSTFSIFAWVALTNQYDAIISKYDYSNDKGWMMYVYAWKLRLTLNKNEAIFESTETLTSGQFALIGVVKDSTSPLVGYINGQEVTYNTQDNGVNVNSPTGLDCLIGDRQDVPDGTYAAEGYISDIFIFKNKAVNSLEAQHIYNMTRRGVYYGG